MITDSFICLFRVCGHFFDWSPEFLHIWVKERRAEILDNGELKWSASTLARVGEAIARILAKPEATKNQVVYVQSFCVTQTQVVKAFEKATSSTWEVQHFDSKQYEKEKKQKAEEGDLEAVEDLVWLLGALDANWETRDGFAMRTLGLENEDLDEAVRSVVKEFQ